MAKKIDSTEDKIHVVEEALSKSEQFIEKHQKTLIIIIGAIIVIGLGIFAFQKLFIQPREKKHRPRCLWLKSISSRIL
ncbi:MAG: hypothetical protein IPH45_00135 [Bacteroidales bacterium]|nr:hypothetical protein [Bacteroidales bacterium]